MNISKVVFLKRYCAVTLFFFSFISAELTHFERGLNFYDQRAEKSIGLKADPSLIGKAIDEFLIAMESPKKELDAGVFLLKCYYFKGKFVSQNDDEKKDIYSKGKVLGEKLINLYPESVSAHYWYLVNLGSWAEIYGIFSAAKEGVADQIKVHAMKVIELDPHYENGGGYFMMGVIHYKSPYIPFLLSWPDNKEAVAFLEKAVGTGEGTPVQKVYLAQALYKEKEKQRALAILNEVASMKPNMDELLYDWEQIKKARGLLKDLQ